MFNLDNIAIKNDNKDWPYRKLIIGPFVVQRGNNIIDNIYLYVKDLEEPKYQLLTGKREKAGLKNLNDQMLLLSILTIWMIFMNILRITTKREKGKF